MSLVDIKRADRRLIMLRALAEEPDYSLSDIVLRGLLAEFGHDVPLDSVRGDLSWLETRDLVTLGEAGSAVVATITNKGVDVAKGRVRVEGVRRPRPGE